MGLKKRNKASAEFSMSSLTDIIFLLLIFFMLTANFVKVQPFELPESDSKTVAPISAIVAITKDGQFELNSIPITVGNLERALREELSGMEGQKDVTVTIVAEKGTPFKDVTTVMQIAGRMKIKAILATQPKKSS
ncbi:MAG: biopolymer transporter ExbD [Saprospirales bacterium]|nr:biopolymer transporter ExbD [Saprospirales bacterium]MBK7335063.1 biopolymer transporter ExbD [Saprospirales bacterium]